MIRKWAFGDGDFPRDELLAAGVHAPEELADAIAAAGWVYVGDLAAISCIEEIITFQANLTTILVRMSKR